MSKPEDVELQVFLPRGSDAAAGPRGEVQAAVLHAARAAVNDPSTASSPAGGSVP
jgi:hypothetical protein